MCAIVAEWSYAQVSGPRDASGPVSIPRSGLFCLSFYFSAVLHIDKAVVNCFCCQHDLSAVWTRLSAR